MVICLGQSADLHTAQLMPRPFTISCSSKSRLVLPFWYWLTQVVSDKAQGRGCKTVVVAVVVVVVVVVQFVNTVDSALVDTLLHYSPHYLGQLDLGQGC